MFMTQNPENRCPVCGAMTRIFDSKGKPCACSRACLRNHKRKRNAEAAKKDANKASKTDTKKGK